MLAFSLLPVKHVSHVSGIYMPCLKFLGIGLEGDLNSLLLWGMSETTEHFEL